MKIRTGQGPDKLSRQEFSKRFREDYADPAYRAEDDAIQRLEQIAWDAYMASRKAPETRAAGPEFHNPAYELSVEWLATRERLRLAQSRHEQTTAPSRVLLIAGAARNDRTCPSEMSKTYRLARIAEEVLTQSAGFSVDLLDLSLLSSEYGRTIHPCKGCVSTAMPLCHWPCSCYPNHSLGQTGDWMAEIYERWVLSHGVMIVTPVYWYQVPSGLKLMIDRLVCADGGNPDPTRTGGKDPKKAKKLELAGWDYPKHLAGRAYSVVVHGDVAGIESVKRSLCDWLEWMRLVPAGSVAKLDRYIGYYEPYATSHDALDKDHALHEEVRNAARALGEAVTALRSGKMLTAGQGLAPPRPK